MKWFKHMADANRDDKIVSIRTVFGMWGVGVYWTLVEKCAEQMKGELPSPIAILSFFETCSLCGCKRNKMKTFLKHLQNIHGMKYEVNGDILKIEIQKLLQIKDNYLKDLEETSKKLPSKEVEEEVDTEVEEEKRYSPSMSFDSIWNLYPNRQGKKNALRHFIATVKSPEHFAAIYQALKNYLASGNVKNGFIKNGSTWFNEWQDWVDPTESMMKGNNNGKSNISPATARATHRVPASRAGEIEQSLRGLDKRS